MAKRIGYILQFCFFLLAFISLPVHSAPKKFVVVIDAGHGGNDPGAIGKKAKEKTINLNTALKLGKLIEQNCADVQVVYTRKTDVFIPLNQRAQIANDAKADLFISIHTNALPKGKIVSGTETYTLGMARADENLEVAKKENSVILMENGYKQTYKGFNPNSSESYIIFEFMQDKNMNQSISFAKKIQQQFKRAGRVDRGVHQAGFLVLRETAMPSVLIELGYISTPQEENYLNTNDGTSTLANSIYRAFLSYKNGQNSSGFNNNDQAQTTQPAATAVKDLDGDLHPIRDNSHQSRNRQSQAVNDTPVNNQKETAQTATPQKQEKPAAQPKRESTASTQKATSASDADAPVFKIQILTASQRLKDNDRQFKGLQGADFYRENGLYKYTYGASTDYNEVLRKKREITSKFPDCFIIAFRGDEKMNVNEAIRIFKNRKK